jgi:hypothetical protein
MLMVSWVCPRFRLFRPVQLALVALDIFAAFTLFSPSLGVSPFLALILDFCLYFLPFFQ